MKRTIEFFAITMIIGWVAPMTALARNCELPHEQLQMKCGGDAPNTFDPEAKVAPQSASAVEKARPAADLLKEYRERSAAYTELVRKADEDYRDSLASRNR